MAVRHSVDAHALGARLARAFSGNPHVRELWIEPEHEEVVFWLITEPIDPDMRQNLHGASLVLFDEDEFEDALFEMRILNPRNFPDGYDLHDSIPARAQRVEFLPNA